MHSKAKHGVILQIPVYVFVEHRQGFAHIELAASLILHQPDTVAFVYRRGVLVIGQFQLLLQCHPITHFCLSSHTISHFPRRGKYLGKEIYRRTGKHPGQYQSRQYRSLSSGAFRQHDR